VDARIAKKERIHVAKLLRKDRVKIPVGKYQAVSRRNYRLFKEDYDNWKNVCSSAKGSSWGQKRAKYSLFEHVQKQGITPRVMGNSGPESDEGGNQILLQVDNIFRTKDYSPEQLQLLKGLVEYMDNVSKGNVQGANPSDIMFTDKRDWNDAGKILRERKVYGHYATKNYAGYRNKFKNDNVKPVDASWYSYNKGEAKPPMWQALYGDGTVLGKNTNSLHKILKEAIDNFDELDLRFDKSTPIPIEGQGSADLALEITEIKNMFNAMVRDEDYTTKAGNFSTTKAQTVIRNQQIDLKNRREVNAIKRIDKELGGIPNDIDTIFITMSRRQMENMANKVGWKKYRDKFMAKRGKKDE
tara:strand:+ start:792 stop:1859 length:1068 start_codon:yes stop_codon:yes gene_type:complete